MTGAALGKIGTRLIQTQLAVDGEPHLGRVFVSLAIVLPPANRAQGECFRLLQGPISTAWASKTSLHGFLE